MRSTIPDDPCDATSIPVSTSCNFISGTNVGATNSSVASIACDGSAMDGDIWFKAVIPPSGDLIIDSDEGSIDDLGMAIYTGTCSSLSYYGCYPNGSTYSTYMPYASLTGLTLVQQFGYGYGNIIIMISGHFQYVHTTHLQQSMIFLSQTNRLMLLQSMQEVQSMLIAIRITMAQAAQLFILT
ncbi:MAG: hypothetical protein IPL74_13570 [Bacteroidetes bacterium]|nr:hypothetical protein [Bacteroidota bacterium]